MAGKSSAINIKILGDATGLSDGLDVAESKLSKFGSMAAIGIAGVATGALAVGKALYGVGSTFDDVTDTIRVGTGATGAALDALTDSAKKIATTVPASFEDAGAMVSDLNTRLGLTGPTLETLSGQMLEAGRMTGEALNVNAFSAAFTAFGVAGDETTKVMDQLWNVSQGTGVSMNRLAESVQAGAPQLKQFGFDIGESAALLGSLDKAGLNGEQVIKSMSRAMVGFAKDGRAPKVALQETAAEIGTFLSKGEDVKALDLAAQIFGTKGAGQFVDAIRAGTLNIEDLTKVVEGTGDTIIGAGQDTADFSEKWELFKNNVLLLIEPAATKVFDAMGKGMGWVAAHLDDIKAGFGKVMTYLAPLGDLVAGIFSGGGGRSPLQPLIDGFQAISSAVQSAWNTASPILTQIGQTIGSVLGDGAGGAGGFFQKFADTVGKVMSLIGAIWSMQWAVIKAVWDVIGPTILSVIATVFESVKGVISGAMDFIQGIVNTVMALISGDWSGAWEGIKQALGGIWDAMTSIVGGALGIIGTVLSSAWEGIKSVMSSAWSGIKDAVSAGINGVVGFVTSLPGKVLAALSGFGSLLYEKGQALIQGLIDGVMSKIRAIGDAMGSVTEKIAGFFHGSPVKEGPLKVHGWNTDAPGRAIGDVLIAGMSASVAGVASASARLASASADLASSVVAGPQAAPALPSGPTVATLDRESMALLRAVVSRPVSVQVDGREMAAATADVMGRRNR